MTRTFDNLKQEKKDAIIQAAMKIFAKQGYEMSSTNVLTKELGISKGSLFKYFETKLGLYKYLVDLSSDKLMTYINDHVEEKKSWKSALLEYARVEFKFMIEDPTTLNFFRRVIKDMHLESLSEIKDSLQKESMAYLSQIYRTLDMPDDIALHTTFVIKGYNEWFNEKYAPVGPKDKATYLEGLNNHLDLIVSEDEYGKNVKG